MLAGAAALALLLGAAPAARAAPDTLAIRRVTVIDGTEAVQPDMTVLMAGGRILVVGPAKSVRVRRSYRVVEGAGRYLIPGLWDMHVHLAEGWPDSTLGAWFLDHGVVGVRDMGTPMARIRALRTAFASATSPGPRIVAAGPFLNGSRAVPGLVLHVETEADGRHAADSVRALGADFVKVLSEIPPAAFRGAASEARRLGLPIVGHLPAGMDPADVSDAGLRSLEHQFGLALSCAYEAARRCAAAGARVSALDTAAVFRHLKQNGTWLTPTFASFARVLRSDDSGRRHDPRLALLPDAVRTAWLADRTAVPRGLAPALARERAMLPPMRAAGLRFLAGTDFGDPFLYPGASLHDEMAELVAAGLTPMEALQAATRSAAEFFGALDSMGTIEQGKVADLVLLEADPLADIGNTRRIAAVVARGELRLVRAPSTCGEAFSDSLAARDLDALNRVAAVGPVWDDYRLARHPLLLLADSSHHGSARTPVCAAIWRAGKALRIIELAERPPFSTALYGMIDLDAARAAPLGSAAEFAAAWKPAPAAVAAALRAAGVTRAVVLNVPLDLHRLGTLGGVLIRMHVDPAAMHADLATHESFHLQVQIPAWLGQHRNYRWPAWDIQPDRAELRHRCYAGSPAIAAALESELGALLAAFTAVAADSLHRDAGAGLRHARRFVEARAARRRLQDGVTVTRGGEQISCGLAEDLLELEEGTAQWIGHATSLRAGLTTMTALHGSYSGTQPEAFYKTGPLQLWVLDGLLGHDALRQVTRSIARSAGPDGPKGGLFAQFDQQTSKLADKAAH